jgi:glycosyltransferase involved in cell wall biosynthesis
MRMTVISVIIPTYNRAHVLKRAIDSVLRQTFQDIEIIIVDDASRDGTEKIIDIFNDKRILYIKHEERKGASAARNTGIEIARGEYVAFLDSDDEWLPEKLAKQIQVFNKSSQKLGLVYTACMEIENSKQQRTVIPKCRGNIIENLLVNNCVGYIVTPLVRKECFTKAGLFDEQLPGSQDWDMWIRIAQYYEIDFVNDILVYVYPQRDGIMKNNAGAILAHKRILRKYEHLVSRLSRKLKAERYLYEGIFFWWKRDIVSCCHYLLKAVFLNPSKGIDIFSYFANKTWEKIISLISKNIKSA